MMLLRAATPPSTPLVEDDLLDLDRRPSSAPGTRPLSPLAADWASGGDLSPGVGMPPAAGSPGYRHSYGGYGPAGWAAPTSPPYPEHAFGPWSPVGLLPEPYRHPHLPAGLAPFSPFSPHDAVSPGGYPPPGYGPMRVAAPSPPPSDPACDLDADEYREGGGGYAPPAYEDWAAAVGEVVAEEGARRGGVVAEAAGVLVAAGQAFLVATALLHREAAARAAVVSAWAQSVGALTAHVAEGAARWRALRASEELGRAAVERACLAGHAALHLQAQRVSLAGPAASLRQREKDAREAQAAAAKAEQRVREQGRAEQRQRVEHLAAQEALGRAEVEVRMRRARDKIALDCRYRWQRAHQKVHARRCAVEVAAAEERGGRGAIAAAEAADLLQIRAAYRPAAATKKKGPKGANGAVRTPAPRAHPTAASLLQCEERLSRLDVESKHLRWWGECWRSLSVGGVAAASMAPRPAGPTYGAHVHRPALPYGVAEKLAAGERLARLEVENEAMREGLEAAAGAMAAMAGPDPKARYRNGRSTLLKEHSKHREQLRDLLSTQDRLLMSASSERLESQQSAERLALVYQAQAVYADLARAEGAAARSALASQTKALRNRIETSDRMYKQAMEISRRVPAGSGAPARQDNALDAGGGDGEQVRRLVQQLNTALQDNQQMDAKIARDHDELVALRKEVTRLKEAERAASYKAAELQDLRRCGREWTARERRLEAEKSDLEEEAAAAQTAKRKAEGVCAELFEQRLHSEQVAARVTAAFAAVSGAYGRHLDAAEAAARGALAEQQRVHHAELALQWHVLQRQVLVGL